MSDPFATAGELAQLIGNPEPTDLARMQLFLDLASAEIRGYAEQTLSPVTGDVEVFAATSSTALWLPQRPVTAVTAVMVGVVPITDYTTSGASVYRSTGWLSGVSVTYNHGYAETTDEYRELKTMCLEAASRAYTLNERSASEFMGSTVAESAGYAPEVFLTIGEKMSLDRFRPVAIG